MVGTTVGIGGFLILLLLVVLILLLLARRKTSKGPPVEEAIYENSPSDPQHSTQHWERQLSRLEAIALAPAVVPVAPIKEEPTTPRGRMSAAWAGSSAFWVRASHRLSTLSFAAGGGQGGGGICAGAAGPRLHGGQHARRRRKLPDHRGRAGLHCMHATSAHLLQSPASRKVNNEYNHISPQYRRPAGCWRCNDELAIGVRKANMCSARIVAAATDSCEAGCSASSSSASSTRSRLDEYVWCACRRASNVPMARTRACWRSVVE